jgi:membrane protein implicated in regulation of membrane protease activity
MSLWVAWIVVACVLGLGEILTMGLYLAPFALGALLAGVVSVIGLGAVGSVAGFLVGSLLAFGLIRPLARRHRHLPPGLRTGTAALVGRRAVVLERIANDEGVGCVKIDGEVWTARAYQGERVFEIGQPVEVVEIRGATALVMD